MQRRRRFAHRQLVAATALGLALTLSASGCGRDFEPFNLLDKLRVLAVQSDPPSLAPGETAVLRALVFEPDGEPVAYSWSWCPLRTGAPGGFECAVTEQELREMVEAVAPGAGALVPEFDLGAEPEAAFDYALPPQLLEGLCELTASIEAPAFVALPDCEDSLVVSIALDVSAGEESVTAIKELPLYFEAEDADNENPGLGEVSAAVGDGAPMVLGEDEVATLLADRRHRLFAEVPAGSAQLFQPTAADGEPEPEPRRENLFMTWFVSGGDTESNRTTFIDGQVSLEELGSNSWRTPDDTAQAALFLVLQDERGGVGWTRRDAQLVEE